MSAPLVSVLLPVRNAEAFFDRALRSVLSQDLDDLELLVVDDRSTDASPAIVRAAAERDSRVRVILGEGRGLVAALNCGLANCRGRFIARMDADDVCRPGRLAAQAAFLETHPELGLVAGQMRVFGLPGLRQGSYPTTHGGILAAAVFDSPVAHPTVMFRASLLEGNPEPFEVSERHAEDYGLWSRWLRRGVRFAALPRVVLDYRVHPGQVSSQQRVEQTRVGDAIRMDWLRFLGLEPGPEEMELHRGAGQGNWGVGLGYLESLQTWLLKLRLAAHATPLFENDAFDGLLAQRWTSALWANRGLGRPLRSLVMASALTRLRHPQAWKPWAAFGGTFLRPRRVL